MDWTNDFLIPVTKLTTLISILGFMSFVILRAVYIKWNKQWKWVLKYKVKGPSVDMVDMINSIKDMTDTEVKTNLYINNYKAKQINELFIE